jgi:HPt (histidine-containing phosphotransfer) domain-containing protein
MIAHTNKNNAATIGALRLARLSLILEESLKRDGSYFKSHMIDDYADELSVTVEYIKDRFKV